MEGVSTDDVEDPKLVLVTLGEFRSLFSDL